MFTGLITHTALVRESNAQTLTLSRPENAKLRIGQSISVSGCCLTVVSFDENTITFDLNPETFEKTTLGSLHKDDVVNLEWSLKKGDPLDGHMVSGHVDDKGVIQDIQKDKDSYRMTVSYDPAFATWLVPKGSIAVDGISLTVNDVSTDHFTVCIIPHTWKVTQLHTKNKGDRVHLEFDMVAKMIARMAQPYLNIEQEKKTA